MMVLAALLAAPAIAHADDEAPAQLYKRATELTRQGRCVDAIPLLERSYALAPSPNSMLLLARCLREGDRIEEAWKRYEASLGKAEELVANGELRYSATATSAREELAKLRKITGILVVKDMPPGGHVEVYGMRVDPLAGVARVRVRAGAARVAIFASEGSAERRGVEIHAEQTTEISAGKPEGAKPVGPGAASPTSEPPPKKEGAPPWILPTAIGAGVLGALGMGAFGFFGLRSDGVRRDLEQCSPSCPSSLRADADRASREQTYANVGLTVGIVGLVACGALLVANASSGGGR